MTTVSSETPAPHLLPKHPPHRAPSLRSSMPARPPPASRPTANDPLQAPDLQAPLWPRTRTAKRRPCETRPETTARESAPSSSSFHVINARHALRSSPNSPSRLLSGPALARPRRAGLRRRSIAPHSSSASVQLCGFASAELPGSAPRSYLSPKMPPSALLHTARRLASGPRLRNSRA